MRAFYDDIGQDDSVCSFEDIAQSRFYAKIFANNCVSKIVNNVSKIRKSAQHDLAFMPITLAEFVISLV